MKHGGAQQTGIPLGGPLLLPHFGMRQIGIHLFLGGHQLLLHFGMRPGGQVHKVGIQPTLGGLLLLGMKLIGIQLFLGGHLLHHHIGMKHGGQLHPQVIGILQFHIGQVHLHQWKILLFLFCSILVNLG